MRPDYSSVLEFYNSFMAEYSIIMEAEETKNQNESNNKTVKNDNTDKKKDENIQSQISSKGGDFIKTLVDKLITFIKISIEKIQNRFSNLLETDKGFKKELRKRELQVKPVEGLEITTYRYDTSFLEGIMYRADAEYTKILNYLYSASENKLVANSTTELRSEYIKKICGKEFESVKDFLEYVKTKFRGKKVAYKYNKAQLPAIIQQAENATSLARNMTKINTDSNIAIKKIKAQIDRQKYTNNSETYTQLKKNLELAKEASSIYLSVASYYTELSIERNMSYRIILKKFYQF